MIRKILTLLFLCSSSLIFGQTGPAGKVAFYEDAGFRGKSFQLTPGEYDHLDQYGLGDNTISSFKVGRGVTLLIFIDYGFGGRCFILSEGDYEFPFHNNDQFSSAKIYPFDESRPKIEFYSEANYHGQKIFADGDRPNGFWDFTETHSMKIPAGLTVTLYSEKDYQGNSLILEGPHEYSNMAYAGWNENGINSIKVIEDEWEVTAVEFSHPVDISQGDPQRMNARMTNKSSATGTMHAEISQDIAESVVTESSSTFDLRFIQTLTATVGTGQQSPVQASVSLSLGFEQGQSWTTTNSTTASITHHFSASQDVNIEPGQKVQGYIMVTPKTTRYNVTYTLKKHNSTQTKTEESKVLVKHSVSTEMQIEDVDGPLLELTDGGIIPEDGKLVSSGRKYELDVKSTGNIALFKTGDAHVLWTTSTNSPGASLSLKNGVLAVVSDGGSVIKTIYSSAGSNKAVKVTLTDDGVIKILNAGGTVLQRLGVGFSDPVVTTNPAPSPAPAPTPAPSGNPAGIAAGSNLDVNKRIYSPNKQYFSVFKADGVLYLYVTGNNTPLWTSGTKGKGGNRCTMQSDGNLAIYNGNTFIWGSSTTGLKTDAYQFKVTDEGKAIVVDSKNKQVWISVTAPAPAPAPAPTPAPTTAGKASLTAGNSLEVNKKISSPNGMYFMVYQTDGNLVLYKKEGSNQSPVWTSGTMGKTGTRVTMQRDGNLAIYNGSAFVWGSANTGKADDNYSLVMEDNGTAVIYNSKHSPVWSTANGGK